ncbi:MAG TPA: hypothetical protein VLF20_05945 [Patescibacteria group bacterium]|nr:hypothetical protein [Patescibacteria group bacterium]
MKYQVVSIKYLIVLCFLSILYTLYLIPHTAYAEGVNLQIQPATLQIRAITPADVKAPFTIENAGANPVTLRIVLSRFRDNGDGLGKPVYTNAFTQADTDEFLNNIQILDEETAVDTLVLGPQQSKQLTLAIPLLKESKKQDHYFSVVFLSENEDQPASPEGNNTAMSTIKTAIALPVLLSINQDNQKTGFLKTFSAPVFLQEGPVPFTVEAQNVGDHFITARGVILIRNMFGQTVGRIEIPKTNILAGSSRISPKVIWDEPFLFGIYHATLSLSFFPEQSLYTYSISFVAFPLVALVGFVVVLLLLLFLILRVRKRMAHE